MKLSTVARRAPSSKPSLFANANYSPSLIVRSSRTPNSELGIHLVQTSLFLSLSDLSSAVHSVRAARRCTMPDDARRAVNAVFTDVLVARAEEYRAAGRVDRASTLLDEVIAVNPSPAALLSRSAVKLQRGDHADAIEDLSHALRTVTPTADMKSSLAAIHHLMGSHSEALKGVRQCLLTDANHRPALDLRDRIVRALNNMTTTAVGLHIAGRNAEVLDVVRRILAIDPTCVVALMAAAGAQAALGQYTESVGLLETALNATTEMTPAEQRRTGYTSARIRDVLLKTLHDAATAALHTNAGLGEAVGPLNAAVQIAPDHAGLRMARGDAFMAFGDQQLAMANYEGALARDPDSQPIKRRIAHLHYRDGLAASIVDDLTLAIGHLVNAVDMDPQCSTYWALKGRLEYRAQSFDASYASLCAALDVDRSCSEARTALAKLCPGGMLPEKYR